MGLAQERPQERVGERTVLLLRRGRGIGGVGVGGGGVGGVGGVGGGIQPCISRLGRRVGGGDEQRIRDGVHFVLQASWRLLF